eukprot:CAMPEP_0206519498 /NCGR_PEP_ID=MMETSP0324_2-20121206/65233_1 /ASSEMBLY_ACC=CAM_ASM_000836 /TAXON_ID=2866 /ORGANISM="Crypthecodinium cohnii, Strain Seligo" /LENGTH=226 /DNA_ID=CAMNT_0054013103 /DNA_START=651 /DNA_END=1333 /DNA_ORIENTATION=+
MGLSAISQVSLAHVARAVDALVEVRTQDLRQAKVGTPIQWGRTMPGNRDVWRRPDADYPQGYRPPTRSEGDVPKAFTGLGTKAHRIAKAAGQPTQICLGGRVHAHCRHANVLVVQKPVSSAFLRVIVSNASGLFVCSMGSFFKYGLPNGRHAVPSLSDHESQNWLVRVARRSRRVTEDHMEGRRRIRLYHDAAPTEAGVEGKARASAIFVATITEIHHRLFRVAAG